MKQEKKQTEKIQAQSRLIIALSNGTLINDETGEIVGYERPDGYVYWQK